jgi:hypothetical protein
MRFHVKNCVFYGVIYADVEKETQIETTVVFIIEIVKI